LHPPFPSSSIYNRSNLLSQKQNTKTEIDVRGAIQLKPTSTSIQKRKFRNRKKKREEMTGKKGKYIWWGVYNARMVAFMMGRLLNFPMMGEGQIYH